MTSARVLSPAFTLSLALSMTSAASAESIEIVSTPAIDSYSFRLGELKDHRTLGRHCPAN